jgi:hypothetical protein
VGLDEFVKLLRILIVVDLRLGTLREASLVVEGAGKFAWQIDIVVDDYFEVDLGELSVREQYYERRLVFVELILRDVGVMDHLCNAHLLDHLRLRKLEALPNLQELLSQSSWTWSRATHR